MIIWFPTNDSFERQISHSASSLIASSLMRTAKLSSTGPFLCDICDSRTALIEHGADLSLADKIGRSPAHMASASGRVKMLALINKVNADHITTNVIIKGSNPLRGGDLRFGSVLCYVSKDEQEGRRNSGFFS